MAYRSDGGGAYVLDILYDEVGEDRVAWLRKWDALLERAEGERLSQAEFKAEMTLLEDEAVTTLAKYEARLPSKTGRCRPRTLTCDDKVTQHTLLVARAMAVGGVITPFMLEPELKGNTRVVADDHGAVTISVVDPQTGKPRLKADGSPISVNELLEEWRLTDPVKAICFRHPAATQIAYADRRNGNGKY